MRKNTDKSEVLNCTNAVYNTICNIFNTQYYENIKDAVAQTEQCSS